jgi:hypothetical protein
MAVIRCVPMRSVIGKGDGKVTEGPEALREMLAAIGLDAGERQRFIDALETAGYEVAAIHTD